QIDLRDAPFLGALARGEKQAAAVGTPQHVVGTRVGERTQRDLPAVGERYRLRVAEHARPPTEVGDPATVRRPGERLARIERTRQVDRRLRQHAQLAAGQVQHAQFAVVAQEGQLLAVGGEPWRGVLAGIAGERAFLAAGEVVQVELAVAVAFGTVDQAAAVRRPGQVVFLGR